ncbi:MAG: RNA-binding protein [Patescibacteria group bacterium]|nr:RNA-binding protein [Patescibacteria group bacterium]
MRIFVGNLPWVVKKEDLIAKFSEFGQVEEENTLIIVDANGRSKGFGFAEMPNEEEAKKAMEALNGQDWEGRAVVVNEARPMKNKE